jgi:phosphoribosylformylglycinamidine synthase subunit PurS
MKARVTVTLKKSVLDPQGKAVQQALQSMGFGDVKGVRMGKVIELDLNGSNRSLAETKIKAMCEKLLANTVIEEYKYEIVIPPKGGINVDPRFRGDDR